MWISEGRGDGGGRGWGEGRPGRGPGGRGDGGGTWGEARRTGNATNNNNELIECFATSSVAKTNFIDPFGL